MSDANALSLMSRPNLLTGVEVVPTSVEIAVLNITGEIGGASWVINRTIAEHAIRELQAFLARSRAN